MALLLRRSQGTIPQTFFKRWIQCLQMRDVRILDTRGSDLLCGCGCVGVGVGVCVFAFVCVYVQARGLE
jgi:hypothetical protein